MLKKLSFFTLLLIATFFIVADTFANSRTEQSFRKIRLVGSFTTNEGCNVAYDVWVDVVSVWGWPPVKINSIEGTLTLSGTCKGKHNINIQMRATATCYPDGTTNITWDYLSDPEVEEILNDPGFLNGFKTEVRNADN